MSISEEDKKFIESFEYKYYKKYFGLENFIKHIVKQIILREQDKTGSMIGPINSQYMEWYNELKEKIQPEL